jgi:hypothetical protein
MIPLMDFAESAARNEEVFRSINERIDRGAAQHDVSVPLPFHCECSDSSCMEKVFVVPDDYERVLDERFQFVVLPGHENSEVEQIVAAQTGYLVVEKIGEARVTLERDHPQQRHRP